MPSSATEGKARIKKIINNLITSPSFRFLDLGCGRGTYARLLEKDCWRVGVDAVDYTDRFKLMDFYDVFHQHDIRDIEFLKSLGKFDLIVAGDVLEHMTVAEARRVLDAMESMANCVLVAVPFEYVQHSKHNPWEEHVQDDLTPELMRERYPKLVPISLHTRKAAPWNGKFFYGYYIWVKPYHTYVMEKVT